MHTLIAFLFAILLLVSLHELGHLLVARSCGIKVLRFSIGFGKPLLKKQWRGIEWCLAPIPLGGYVKMLDTREGNVPTTDEHLAFDKQHPLKRIAVVIAGPITNLLLAIALFSGSFYIGGVYTIQPYVGSVEPHTIAERAGFQYGDKITAINGTTISTWTDAQMQILLNIEAGPVNIAVQTAQHTPAVRTIRPTESEASAISKQKQSIGIIWQKFSDKIGEIIPNSPAQQAGLKKGDKIIAVNNQPTPHWQDWATIIRNNGTHPAQLTVQRDTTTFNISIQPSTTIDANGQTITYIGVASQPDEKWLQQVRHHEFPNLIKSIKLASDKTFSYIRLTLKFFYQLLSGNASFKHLSGPVAIADAAGKTAQMGWQPYVEFLALVSASLGIMNLLPIPILDGGHLVYYTAEFIRGKPLNKRFQEWGLRIGLALMLMMMVLALFNDITQLIG